MTETDKTPAEGELAKIFHEQLELAAARLPVLDSGLVHPSPVDHDERLAPHADIEDLMLGNVEATPEMLDELAAMQTAPALSDEELARQALAAGSVKP